MGDTDNRNYPYPGTSEAPAGPLALQLLAEAVDTDVDTLFTSKAAREKDGRGVIGSTVQPATSVGLNELTYILDAANVSLIAGRWYRVSYRLHITSPVANVAYALTLKKSLTTDNTTAGTEIPDAHTIYAAPVATLGASRQCDFIWQAGTTETVKIKTCIRRLTGAALYDVATRNLNIADMGATL